MKLTEASEIITFKTGKYIDRHVLYQRIKKGSVDATMIDGRYTMTEEQVNAFAVLYTGKMNPGDIKRGKDKKKRKARIIQRHINGDLDG